MTLRAKESRAETITGGLSVPAVRQARPDMTASEALAAVNLVRRSQFGERIYHLSGGKWYDQTKIDPATPAVDWRELKEMIATIYIENQES